VLLGLAFVTPRTSFAQTEPLADRQSFATPEAASEALKGALAKDEPDALIALFGRGNEEIVFGIDPAESRAERRQVNAMLQEKLTLRRDRPDHITLVAGRENWPLAIPLVRRAGRWAFDTEAGADELLARRIGRNELGAIEALKAFARAQTAYAARLRKDGHPVHYARYVQSTEGQTDGLWWDAATARSEGPSPLAKFTEREREFLSGRQPGDPYRGYYFRILTGQGEHARGGAMSYVVDGELKKGYAMVAWPVDYGASGIMTFLVGRDGRVLQKDLGEETASLVQALAVYDPDATWRRAEPVKKRTPPSKPQP
jgi:hypothetical protein